MKRGGGNIMVWAALLFLGTRVLFRLDGIMNISKHLLFAQNV